MIQSNKILATTFLSVSAISGAFSASNALAVTIGFNTFTNSGDVSSIVNSANLSNDYVTFQDDSPSPMGTFNFSGNSPVDAGSLANFLNVPVNSLDPDPGNFIFAFEGSALKRNFTNVVANTTISFNWNFLTNETGLLAKPDYAFVVIDDQVISLADISNATQPSNPFDLETGVNSYSYTFTQDGDYSFAIGVLDVLDGVDSSALSLTNLQLNPPNIGTSTPEPTSLISLLALGLIGLVNKSLNRKDKN